MMSTPANSYRKLPGWIRQFPLGADAVGSLVAVGIPTGGEVWIFTMGADAEERLQRLCGRLWLCPGGMPTGSDCLRYYCIGLLLGRRPESVQPFGCGDCAEPNGGATPIAAPPRGTGAVVRSWGADRRTSRCYRRSPATKNPGR